MKTITITEEEYHQMKKKIEELQLKLKLLEDEDFMHKLKQTYNFFITQKTEEYKPAVSLKRGSAKGIITYIADDFTAPLSDFNDYM